MSFCDWLHLAKCLQVSSVLWHESELHSFFITVQCSITLDVTLIFLNPHILTVTVKIAIHHDVFAQRLSASIKIDHHQGRCFPFFCCKSGTLACRGPPWREEWPARHWGALGGASASGSRFEGGQHLGKLGLEDAEQLRELIQSGPMVSVCNLLASSNFPRREERTAWFPRAQRRRGCEVGCLLALPSGSPFNNK